MYPLKYQQYTICYKTSEHSLQKSVQTSSNARFVFIKILHNMKYEIIISNMIRINKMCTL